MFQVFVGFIPWILYWSFSGPGLWTVAIIGGGISGLTAAYDLARKGWGVVIYESSDKLGGNLWKIPPDILPREVLVKDFNFIKTFEIEVRFNSKIGWYGGNGHATIIEKLANEYDAIYLAVGAYSGDLSDLRLNEQGQIDVEPLTLQTSHEKVFAGGDVLRVSPHVASDQIEHSAVLSISEGRRAAISIDRFLQRVSLTASRINEGPYETKLYTNVDSISPLGPIAPFDSLTRLNAEMAETEASRCIQCECLECVKQCEYLSHYKGYPKKYIREVYNNLAIVMGTRHSNQFINTCALCGQCAEICPTDVNMGEVCHEARVTMVEQNRMPPSAHDFALRDMAFSNSDAFALSKGQPGNNETEIVQYAFFPGCQLSGSSPHHVESAYGYLREKLSSVGLMLRCCGSPASWAARKDIFAQSQKEFYAEYHKLGDPTLILACSSCHQAFRQQYPDVKIQSLWEIYDKFGFELSASKVENKTITIHDPCSTRYENGIQDSVRNTLTKKGFRIEELSNSRERTECCSFGGVMWLANRPVAEKMVQKRISESPLDYLTYCAMCRDFFAKRGKGTLHLLDVIYSDENANADAVGFSQKHENRARLKNRLLKELWSEEMAEIQSFEKIKLQFDTDIKNTIEDRLILVEDIQKVIEHAERTKKRMLNSKTGHYLASFKPHSVTYWVEYLPHSDGSFHIFKAYSHRMEIGIGG